MKENGYITSSCVNLFFLQAFVVPVVKIEEGPMTSEWRFHSKHHRTHGFNHTQLITMLPVDQAIPSPSYYGEELDAKAPVKVLRVDCLGLLNHASLLY